MAIIKTIYLLILNGVKEYRDRRISREVKQQIANSKLSKPEISKIYGISTSYVKQLRREYRVSLH